MYHICSCAHCSSFVFPFVLLLLKSFCQESFKFLRKTTEDQMKSSLFRPWISWITAWTQKIQLCELVSRYKFRYLNQIFCIECVLIAFVLTGWLLGKAHRCTSRWGQRRWRWQTSLSCSGWWPATRCPVEEREDFKEQKQFLHSCPTPPSHVL